MRGIPSGKDSELREVTLKPRILRLKQVLDARVLEDRPKILHETWLRIQTEQVAEFSSVTGMDRS